ncbi:MAG: tRNA guanosine(34) transglycosylase Tgt [bacterium]
MFFQLKYKDKKSRARTGIIQTPHGSIETPCFMPVGTSACVKTLDQQDLQDLKSQIILANTYHLHLRPGEDLIQKAGGLHGFMNWNKPILTDSGGFQVFSLGQQKEKKNIEFGSFQSEGNSSSELKQSGCLVKIDKNGVDFRSHIDGSLHRFTPQSAIDVQHKLGADIIMAFDECTPDNASKDYAQSAMQRTHDWAKQCLERHVALKADKNRKAKKHEQYLFGIIQGSNYMELRKESARYICGLDFDGIAVGGESIGYNMEMTVQILDWVYEYLPDGKPCYSMGVGLNPADLFKVVDKGIDMFDCVAPTRLARHGIFFIKNKKNNHRFNILNAKYTQDFQPVDKGCSCVTCRNYSRAYLNHLFKAREFTAKRLATIHNLHFLLQMMKDIRDAIKEDRFAELKKEWV